MGANGRSTVRDNLRQEQIVGSPDMTPAAIKAEAAKAGLKGVSLPTCSVAGVTVTNGAQARCFASYMRIHALEASGGQTYSQMARYATKDGKGTNDAAAAAQEQLRSAARQPGPQRLDQRDGAQHRTQRQLHGRPARALRSGRRHRPAAQRHRVHRARRLRDGAHRSRRREAGHARRPLPRHPRRPSPPRPGRGSETARASVSGPISTMRRSSA